MNIKTIGVKKLNNHVNKDQKPEKRKETHTHTHPSHVSFNT